MQQLSGGTEPHIAPQIWGEQQHILASSLYLFVKKHFGSKPILKITMCILYLHSLVIASTKGSRGMLVNKIKSDVSMSDQLKNRGVVKAEMMYAEFLMINHIKSQFSEKNSPP